MKKERVEGLVHDEETLKKFGYLLERRKEREGIYQTRSDTRGFVIGVKENCRQERVEPCKLVPFSPLTFDGSVGWRERADGDTLFWYRRIVKLVLIVTVKWFRKRSEVSSLSFPPRIENFAHRHQGPTQA